MAKHTQAAEPTVPEDLSRLADVSIPVIVRLGTLKLSVSALAQLAPGQVLPLVVEGNTYPELVAADRVLASGVLVRRGQRVGLCLRQDPRSQSAN